MTGVSDLMASYIDPIKATFPLKRLMNPKLFSEVEENLYGQSLEPLQQLQKWAKIRREKEVENMELKIGRASCRERVSSPV